MKLLLVHPGPLMYTKIFLRLEPLGLEVVGEAARRGGHEVRLIDLQIESHADYHALCAAFEPNVVAFSCNYLANLARSSISPRRPSTNSRAPRSWLAATALPSCLTTC